MDVRFTTARDSGMGSIDVQKDSGICTGTFATKLGVIHMLNGLQMQAEKGFELRALLSTVHRSSLACAAKAGKPAHLG